MPRELPCVYSHPVSEVSFVNRSSDYSLLLPVLIWTNLFRFAFQELLLRHFCNLLSSYFCWRTCVRSTFQENQKRGQGSLKEEPHEPISLTNAMPLQQEYCFLMKDFWTSDFLYKTVAFTPLRIVRSLMESSNQNCLKIID